MKKKIYSLTLQNVRKNVKVQILAFTTLHPSAVKGIDHLCIFMCSFMQIHSREAQLGHTITNCLSWPPLAGEHLFCVYWEQPVSNHAGVSQKYLAQVYPWFWKEKLIYTLLYHQMCVLTGFRTRDPNVSVQRASFWVERTFPCWYLGSKSCLTTYLLVSVLLPCCYINIMNCSQVLQMRFRWSLGAWLLKQAKLKGADAQSPSKSTMCDLMKVILHMLALVTLRTIRLSLFYCF